MAVSTLLLMGACGGEVDQDLTSSEGALVSLVNVMVHATNAGLACNSNLVTAGAVAYAESQLNPYAVGYNPRSRDCPYGSRDRGLWQINDCYHSYSDACAFDPGCNARAMAAISSFGTNWRPWSSYVAGTHWRYMSAAREAYGSVCGGGDSRGEAPRSGNAVAPRPGGDFAALKIGAQISEGSWVTQCTPDVDAEVVWQTNGTGPDPSSSWGEAQYVQNISASCGLPSGGKFPIVFRSFVAGDLGAWVSHCSSQGGVELVFRIDSEVDGHPAAVFLYPQKTDDCP